MSQKTITRKLSIYINGKEVKNNLAAVGKEIGSIKKQLRGLTPGTEAFVKKSKDIKKAQQAYAEINKDRKRTRLNSSHRCISYADFCLKKKQKKKTKIQT